MESRCSPTRIVAFSLGIVRGAGAHRQGQPSTITKGEALIALGPLAADESGMWGGLRSLHRILLGFCVLLGVAWIAFGYFVGLNDPAGAGAEMLALALGFLAPALAGAGAGWRWGFWFWRWLCAQHCLFNTKSCACQLGSWTCPGSVSGRWPFSSVSQSVQSVQCFWPVAFQFSQFSQSVFLAGGLSVQSVSQISSVQSVQSVFLAGGLSVQSVS